MENMVYLLLGILCLSFFSDCEKDKICLTPEISCTLTNEYVPLAIGNYWIYEVSRYDPSTYVGTFSNYDTVRVVGDTIIRNHRYFTLEEDANLNTRKDTFYWRDSSGYLINERGFIKFSAIDFDNILESFSHVGGIERRTDFSVKDSFNVQITPAGIFNCLNYKGRLWLNGVENPNYAYHNCFAKGVGLVFKNTFPASFSVTMSHKKLSEYHLED